MQIMVTLDLNSVRKSLDAMLEAGRRLLKESQNVFGISTKDAVKILLDFQPEFFDKVLDTYRMRGGERAEASVAEYYFMLATAYGMVKREQEGKAWFAKGSGIRTGGTFFEWAQPYYNKK